MKRISSMPPRVPPTAAPAISPGSRCDCGLLLAVAVVVAVGVDVDVDVDVGVGVVLEPEEAISTVSGPITMPKKAEN